MTPRSAPYLSHVSSVADREIFWSILRFIVETVEVITSYDKIVFNESFSSTLPITVRNRFSEEESHENKVEEAVILK